MKYDVLDVWSNAVCAAVSCSVLQCVVVLQWIVSTIYFILKRTAWSFGSVLFGVLKDAATHCNALQHIAAHCNTLHKMLQHTATHCNT